MPFGRKHVRLPQTKTACQRLWGNASPRTLKKGFLTVAGNTELHNEGGVFRLYFHNHCIVEYFDNHKVVNAYRHSSSPTTQGRIQSATGASMYSNSSLGYEESVRIGGYPYFDGIRVDNYGQVLEEDRRPDYKRVNKKAVVNAYTTLFRRIEKLICGRYDLGEWGDLPISTTEDKWDALLDLEGFIIAGETFLPHPLIATLLGNNIQGLRDALSSTKETLRDKYYTHNDGYERVEVK